MNKSLSHAVESSPSLRPFVRKGIEGGCIACRQPISAHVDARGGWIGCQAPHIPVDVPFFLIPDRRAMGRRVTPEPKGPQSPELIDRRRATPPLDASVAAESAPTHTPARQAPTAPHTPTNGRKARTSTADDIPANRQVTPGPTTRDVRRRTIPTGPQVAYVARYAVTDSPIERLPPHDRKVYGLIARSRKNGATRGGLLDALNARKHTGRVDGAIRRLRLKKVITVRAVEAE